MQHPVQNPKQGKAQNPKQDLQNPKQIKAESWHRAIILGGAQIGMRYGITHGQFMPQSELTTFLKKAFYLGFRSIDLAQAYGCAEQRIGAFFSAHEKYSRQGHSHWQIGTKVHIAQNPEELVARRRKLRTSRAQFGSFAYVLLHSFAPQRDFHAHLHPRLYGDLWALRKLAATEKIGVSLYYPEELEFLLRGLESGECPPLDWVQLPYSAADRRFEPYFSKLRNLDIGLQVRSVYLQGLLFCKPQELSKLSGAFSPLRPLLKELDGLAAKTGLSRQDLLLLFVLEKLQRDFDRSFRLVLGLGSVEQLLQLHYSLKRISTLTEAVLLEQLGRYELAENVLVPALWNTACKNSESPL